MFKKTTAKVATLTSTLVAVALLSTACGTPAPVVTDNYTGTAIVKEHHRSGKKCKATVELKEGSQAGKQGEVKLGRKSVCNSINDGDKVKFENGSYKGKA